MRGTVQGTEKREAVACMPKAHLEPHDGVLDNHAALRRHPDHVLPAQDRTGQDRTGQNRTGQDRTGQDRTGHDRTGQDRTGQDRTGQDRIG
jgi:hypothetical protein